MALGNYYIGVPTLLAFLGGFLTAYAVYSDKKRLAFLGSGIVLIAGIFIAIDQGNYERQLKEKTEKILHLQNTVLSNVTGGESYCYLLVGFDAKNPLNIFFMIRREGEHPVFDVKVQITDDNKLSRLAGTAGGNASVQLLNQATQVYNYGTMPPGGIEPIIAQIKPGSRESLNFRVLITARNSTVVQKIRLKKMKDHWARSSTGKVNIFGAPVVELNESDPDFPK